MWNKVLKYGVLVIISVFMVGSSYVLSEYVESLKIQRQVKDDLSSKKPKLTSAYVIKSYPKIPSLTQVAEGVEIQKARYLVNEKKYDEAYAELINNNSSPFDGRREFMLARMFFLQKKYDSVIKYGEICASIKPRFYNNLFFLAYSYEKKKRYEESLKIWSQYATHTKDNRDVWKWLVKLDDIVSKKEGGSRYLDSIKKYFKEETLVKDRLSKKEEVGENLYDRAADKFREKSYKEARKLYDNYLLTKPNDTSALKSRAFCYYFEKKYAKSNSDIELLLKMNGKTSLNLMNLRGVNYLMLKQKSKACEAFKEAETLGSKDGAINYKKYCLK